MKLHPTHPSYPRALYHLAEPPPLRLSGPLTTGPTVAIVGSRSGSRGSIATAFHLGYHLARAGVTVVSGGAIGVDRAAHEGALAAGGTTWLVSPAGLDVVFPSANEDLFERIRTSDTSRIISPFRDDQPKTVKTPRQRNRVLVALSEHVVVVQAAAQSGSRNAARCARELGRTLWVVPGGPADRAFYGSTMMLLEGAKPLWSVEQFFDDLGLPPPDLTDPRSVHCDLMPLGFRIRQRPQLRLRYGEPARSEADESAWTAEEKLVFSVLSLAPTDQEEIVAQTALPPSSTLTALLTLSLKDVVVEGPDGFFRRRVSS